jgi:hypothetical protein
MAVGWGIDFGVHNFILFKGSHLEHENPSQHLLTISVRIYIVILSALPIFEWEQDFHAE